MNITFSCENCNSQFTVDSAMVGRRARCRKCNQRMRVPAQSDESAEGSERPDRDRSDHERQDRDRANHDRSESRHRSHGSKSHGEHKSSRRPAAPEPPPVKGAMSWFDAVSQIDMKPITIMSESPIQPRDEEFESSITSYKLPIPAEMRPVNAVVNKTKQMVESGKRETIHSYKQFFKRFAYLFRRINEISYGASIVFFIIALVEGYRGVRSITMTCIFVIVLLNVVGVAAGISNLIALQFRGSPLKGLLFLFPPVSLYYLWTNSAKWKKPINRVMTPIVVLCAVVGAYMYIPFLNGSKSGEASWQDAVGAIKEGEEDLLSKGREKFEEVKGELPDDMRNIDFDKIKKKAVDTYDGVKGRFQDSNSTGSKPEVSSGGDEDPPQKPKARAKNDAPQKSGAGQPAKVEISRPNTIEIGAPPQKDP